MRSPVIGCLLACLLSANLAWSQSGELIIQGQTGKLYLVHTVVAKENWYSIGRLYNELPKTITAFNNLSPDKPLEIGQQVNIPLTPVNFSQNGQKTARETLVPLIHIIQEKEWLYRISVNHNKVPIANLEKWNHIKKDQVKEGMHLVVGYLKVKTALSALAKPPVTPVAGGEVVAAAPVTGKKEPAEDANKAVETKLEDKPAVIKPAENKPVMATAAPALNFKGGFFKADFTDAGRTATGLAGVFKSTSGWQDGKYYGLMNNTPVGTIVKVSVASTTKSVYVKVLGQLPDMKESAGLTIRISNAAAGELGVGDARFNVEVKY